jgi:hypothetical protein
VPPIDRTATAHPTRARQRHATRLRTLGTLGTLLAFGAIGAIGAPAASAACTLTGNGTTATPYLIGTAADMAQLGLETINGCGIDKEYALTADIVMTGYGAWNGAGTTASPFTGVLDGNGWTVRSLTATAGDSYGLFSKTSHGASIKNLTVDGFNLSGAVTSSGPTLQGTIVGEHTSGLLTIRNVHVTNGAVAGRSGGGLVGANTSSSTVTLSGVSFDGTVTMYDDAGGLYNGEAGTLNVTNAFVAGTIASTTGHAGGVAGRAVPGSLDAITVRADVSSGSGTVGGVIGTWPSGGGGTLRHLDVAGDLTGSGIVGGIVGFLQYTATQTLQRAVYRGTISATGTNMQVGGLIGRSMNMSGSSLTLTVQDAYTDGDVVFPAGATGGLRVGGLVGTQVRLSNPTTLSFVRSLGAMRLFSDGTADSRPRTGTPGFTYGTGGLLGVAEGGITVTAQESYHRPNTGGNGTGVVLGSIGYYATTTTANTDPVAGTRLARTPTQALADLPLAPSAGWGTATTWRAYDAAQQPWGQTILVNEGYPYLLFETTTDPALATVSATLSTTTPASGESIAVTWTATPSPYALPPSSPPTLTCTLDGAVITPCTSTLVLDAGTAGPHQLVLGVTAPYTGSDTVLSWTTSAPPPTPAPTPAPAPTTTTPTPPTPAVTPASTEIPTSPRVVPVPGATRCQGAACTTTGMLPAGASTVSQIARQSGAVVRGRCTVASVTTARGPRKVYACTLSVGQGTWRISTQALKNGVVIARTVKTKQVTCRTPTCSVTTPSAVTG